MPGQLLPRPMSTPLRKRLVPHWRHSRWMSCRTRCVTWKSSSCLRRTRGWMGLHRLIEHATTAQLGLRQSPRLRGRPPSSLGPRHAARCVPFTSWWRSRASQRYLTVPLTTGCRFRCRRRSRSMAEPVRRSSHTSQITRISLRRRIIRSASSSLARWTPRGARRALFAHRARSSYTRPFPVLEPLTASGRRSVAGERSKYRPPWWCSQSDSSARFLPGVPICRLPAIRSTRASDCCGVVPTLHPCDGAGCSASAAGASRGTLLTRPPPLLIRAAPRSESGQPLSRPQSLR
mmetsp:Transcript_7756/g.25420  ORF Transcript_7756/g.25420 Transcript_7756/m.25420 type:complete len:290 (+) Transcript_7756:615-1484(+)